METSYSYIPILILFLVAAGFVGFTIVATHFLGPSRKTDEKLENFESGIEKVGNARQPFAIKYFLVAILFVLFDVEVIFFYPYAANFKALGWEGFAAVVTFIGLFLVMYMYARKKGAFRWEK
ncbi:MULTISPECIES: NADH-quinone oxidoreductase subunit A [Weeksella]|uniref:NADH-quinone oxidoreductase subunit A n=1 Tax=Weeksella TaxID=1013 RepID=UPI0008A42861|nr:MULTISPECIES: NADH-quinone oxidoreductase subunit A [Weeksella]OFM84728.1 NADH-quinone oxidoreductase subunit A [Weeksella sp. HMSC059D05]SUP53811.1 NAD(P)H-quinone oxidoreductase subunit 3 [Weeksella virosa]